MYWVRCERLLCVVGWLVGYVCGKKGLWRWCLMGYNCSLTMSEFGYCGVEDVWEWVSEWMIGIGYFLSKA